MYPEQPTSQTPSTSIDYLNQIAPQPQKPSRFNPRNIILIGGGAILAVIVLVIFASLFNHSDKNQLEHLAARLQTTGTIADKYQSSIKDSTLQSLNVTLQLYLSNTNRTITTPLTAVGVDTTNLDDSIVALESGNTITSKLDDAKLNGVFDNTYANELSYQLSTIITLMKELYTTTSDTSLKVFLNTAYKNLVPIQKQLSSFNSTDS